MTRLNFDTFEEDLHLDSELAFVNLAERAHRAQIDLALIAGLEVCAVPRLGQCDGLSKVPGWYLPSRTCHFHY